MSLPRILLGRYEMGDVIGSGATADVHLARDLRLGRPVAIKVLRRHLARDPAIRSRFRREAAMAAGLDHPAIVAIFDTGLEEVDADPAGTVRVPFIAMEYVVGWSLRDLLKTRAIALSETIHYQAQILEALDFSHRAGIIHRDIKPANVIVTATGAIKVVDFGIARSHDDPAATLTLAQAFLGTPSYLSPEQALGEVAGASSDLYSAGCLLHELLTGRPPFVGGDPVSLVYQHVHEEPAPLNTGIAALDAVVAKALAKAPEDRFRSARAFQEALQAACPVRLTTSTVAPEHHPPERNESWDSSPSEKRTPPRSSCTTRTTDPVSPSS